MVKKIHAYPLFVALTRTPMMMGVTQTFFVLNLVTSMSLLFISKNLIISGSILIVLHVIGQIGCKKEEKFFEILLGTLELQCPNKKLWGCNSYDPE